MEYIVYNQEKNTKQVMNEVQLYKLLSWMGLKSVQTNPGDTRVDDHMYGGFFPYIVTHIPHPIRPLVIWLDGVRQSEEDMRNFMKNFKAPVYKQPFAWEDSKTFRKTPVPNTSKNRCHGPYRSRMGKNSIYTVLFRSRYGSRCWKDNFRCKRAWMKHKENSNLLSHRDLAIKLEADYKQAEQEMYNALYGWYEPMEGQHKQQILDEDNDMVKDGVDLSGIRFPEWE